MVSVKSITAQETYFLRERVLRKNINLPYEFDGDSDEFSFHLGVFENNILVCIGSFMKVSIEELNGNQYQLRGMATDETVRGKGYGKLLLEVATNELIKRNVNFLWCNAREKAVAFYEKNDFQILGDRFINKVGPHYKMFKIISK